MLHGPSSEFSQLRISEEPHPSSPPPPVAVRSSVPPSMMDGEGRMRKVSLPQDSIAVLLQRVDVFERVSQDPRRTEFRSSIQKFQVSCLFFFLSPVKMG